MFEIIYLKKTIIIYFNFQKIFRTDVENDRKKKLCNYKKLKTYPKQKVMGKN